MQVLRKLKEVLGDVVVEGFVLDFEPGMYIANVLTQYSKHPKFECKIFGSRPCLGSRA